MIKRFRLADMEHTICQTLSEGKTFQFYPRGTSMEPFINQGQDQVVISALPERLKKYQVILYKRRDGRFVLHRIVKITSKGYTMRGDNQFLDEPEVQKNQMIGMVSAVIRNGREMDMKAFRTIISACFWVETVKLRYYNKKIRRLLGKIKRKVLR